MEELVVSDSVKKTIFGFGLITHQLFVEAKNTTDREALLELALHVRDIWIKEYDNGGKHTTDKSSCQQEEQTKKPKRVQDRHEVVFQKTVSKDEFDFFETVLKKKKITSTTKVKIPNHCNNIKEVSLGHKTINSDVKFVENILSLRDEVEGKSPHLPTTLHKVLFDEAEHASQCGRTTVACTTKKAQLSEDSGIGSENPSEEGSASVKTKQGVIVNDVRSLLKSNQITVDSLEYILKCIKTEMDSNINEVVLNWKDSLVELACSEVCRCSLKGTEYEEIICDFIEDFLQEIWIDVQINQHSKWSQQISVIGKLLKTPHMCLEVLVFTTDVLDIVTKSWRRGCCTPLSLVKVALFMDLYSIATRTLTLLLEQFEEKPLQKSISVTQLWQEKFSSVPNEDLNHDLVQRIVTDIIPKVSGFLTSAVTKEPLLSLVAKEALEELTSLCRTRDSQISQESNTDMY